MKFLCPIQFLIRISTHRKKKKTVSFAESISQLGVHQLMKCSNKNTEAVPGYGIHPTASSHPLKLTGVNLNW